MSNRSIVEVSFVRNIHIKWCLKNLNKVNVETNH